MVQRTQWHSLPNGKAAVCPATACMPSSASLRKRELYVPLGQPVAEGHQGVKHARRGQQELRKRSMAWSGDTTVWIQGKGREQDVLW